LVEVAAFFQLAEHAAPGRYLIWSGVLQLQRGAVDEQR